MRYYYHVWQLCLLPDLIIKVSRCMALPKSSPRKSDFAVHPLFLVLIGWLIPGSGFLLLGPKYRTRGILYILVLHLTFFIGVALRGGVVWPVWSISAPGFSIMNNLTFIAQMGAGWLWIVSLIANIAHWGAIAALEPHPYFELGSFYCLVTGALNYFVITQSLDRSKKKAFERLARQ